jgi:hypothetical protein
MALVWNGIHSRPLVNVFGEKRIICRSEHCIAREICCCIMLVFTTSGPKSGKKATVSIPLYTFPRPHLTLAAIPYTHPCTMAHCRACKCAHNSIPTKKSKGTPMEKPSRPLYAKMCRDSKMDDVPQQHRQVYANEQKEE